MSTVDRSNRAAGAYGIAAQQGCGVTQADRDLAKNIRIALSGVHLQPGLTGQAPRLDDKGRWVSADNKPLIQVFDEARTPPPGASGSGSSRFRLVDPSSNRVWEVTTRGLAGGMDARGPGKLPPEQSFQGGRYDFSQVAELQRLVPEPPQPQILPR